ncbi:MAG: glycosyltransferase family 39 protein [Candidatus Eisenbacteria bacterium]
MLRPPGLPWLISLADRGRDIDPAALNRMIMAFAALSVIAVYFAFRTDHGRPMALAAAMLTGTSPLFVSRFNWIQSEFPFLALLYLGLGCLALSLRSGGRRIPWALAAGGAFAAAFYFRTTGILVAPLLLLLGLAAGRGGGRRSLWTAAAVTVLIALPWFVHTARVAPAREVPPDQLLLHDYKTAMFHTDPGDPRSPRISAEAWGRRIRSNGAALAVDLSEGLFGGGRWWAGMIAGIAALAGFVIRPRSVSRAAGAFGILYGAVLTTYFAYATRLVTPLVPVLYLYGIVALSWAGRRAADRFRIPRGGALLPAACVFLLLAVNVARLPGRLGTPQITVEGREVRMDGMWEETFATARWIRERTPPGSTILCFSAPVYGTLTGRTAYTYRFPRGGDLLAKYDPDFVLFDIRTPASDDLEGRVATAAKERWFVPSRIPGRSMTAYRLTDTKGTP